MTKSALIKFLEPYPDDIEIWGDDGVIIYTPKEVIVQKVTIYKIQPSHYPFPYWGDKNPNKEKILEQKEVLFIGL